MRYKNQQIFTNSSQQYKTYLEKTRGLKEIKQFDTHKLNYPTREETSQFSTIAHIWTTGDRFFKLADEYYEDPELWWVIALFNRTPTESHVKLGDSVQIPIPLEKILLHFGM